MGLLQRSFSGAVFILAVIVIRSLAVYKLPKKTFSILWKIVALRLLIPFSVPSIFNIYTFASRFFSASEEAMQLPESNGAGAENLTGAVSAALTGQLGNMDSVFPAQRGGTAAWWAVWGIGMAACAAFFLFSYFGCRRSFRLSLPVHNDFAEQWQEKHRQKRRIAIRQSNQISSPLTYGILRPVVLMPKEMDWEDTQLLEYVLAHEYAHIRRLDAATKLVSLLVLCIHWFNPMVWVMYILFNRDMELACDEEVVSRFGEESRSSYALTLIGMEEKKDRWTLLYNNFSRNSIEERIRSIMKYKKISKSAIVLAMALVISATATFATSPAKADEADSTVEKREIVIEDTREISLVPGAQIKLWRIRAKKDQVIIITATGEGVQWIGEKLTGQYSSSDSEGRLENYLIFTSVDMYEGVQDYVLTIYNPSNSPIKAVIGYAVADGGPLNDYETDDLRQLLLNSRK